MKTTLTIREAQPNDTKALLALMRKLAKFEGYLDQFTITDAALKHHAFEKGSFKALVAERSDTQSDNQLVGMLVYYFLPFTYDLTPWLFIKELYVEPAFRGQAIGELLMQKTAQICRQHGGQKMVWSVLSDNVRAQHFYQRLGAQHDVAWQPYGLDSPAIDQLADSDITSGLNTP